MNKIVFAFLAALVATQVGAVPPVFVQKPGVVPAEAMAPAPAAGSKEAQQVKATVTVANGKAQEAEAPRLSLDGAVPVEASFDVMLPVVARYAQWTVAKVKPVGSGARLSMDSKDKKSKLEMSVGISAVKVGDVIEVTVNQGRLMVFSLRKAPVGFMVKDGTDIQGLR